VASGFGAFAGLVRPKMEGCVEELSSDVGACPLTALSETRARQQVRDARRNDLLIFQNEPLGNKFTLIDFLSYGVLQRGSKLCGEDRHLPNQFTRSTLEARLLTYLVSLAERIERVLTCAMSVIYT
jgi:hypothetical protein